MAYPTKFTGMRYALWNKGWWDGQCPYNMHHARKMRGTDSRKELMFQKWHKIGMRVERRRTAKPYRLYWRLHPSERG